MLVNVAEGCAVRVPATTVEMRSGVGRAEVGPQAVIREKNKIMIQVRDCIRVPSRYG